MNQNLKKQGLLLLVSKYINEPTSSLLHFIRANELSTKMLAENLHSHQDKGLSFDQVEQNREDYGSNVREQKENAQWGCIRKIAQKELVKFRNLFIFFMVFFEIICGKVYQIKEMQLSGGTILVAAILSFGIKIGTRFREKLLIQQQKNNRTQKKYYVYRESEKVQVLEKDIVVGDVLLIDFAEPIPVSGILVTEDEEIEMDENLYGKNIQPKKPIQQCLSLIENKNQLQLRIDTQVGRLPSPMILRGTTCTNSSWFRMLVLCVEQTQILEKCSLKVQKQRGVSVIENWINSTTKLMRKITSSITTFIFIFHVLALIFKIKGAPKGQGDILCTSLIQSSQSFLCISILIDPTLLKDLLRASYTKVVNMLKSYKDVDNYLAVQQIFLTEQSVFKYDKISINKVALAGLEQPVDAQLLPALKPQQAYPLFYQIIAGVHLGEDLYQPQSTSIHKNTIIHKINYQQRIVTSLYTSDSERMQHSSINQGDSISQLLKTHGRMNIELKTSNKINPSTGNYQNIKRLPSLRYQTKQLEKKALRNKENQQKIQGNQFSQGKTVNKLHLDDYISKHCHFSAHSLVQGINILVQNRSRTYCFQSFSLQRLENVVSIWSDKQFKPRNRELVQKMRDNITKMEQSGLRVYLIGFEQGLYPKKYISNLFGAVGVKIECDLEIEQKISLLEKAGINNTFIISSSQLQSQRQQVTAQIQEQLLKRNWVQSPNEFIKMQTIVQKGGRTLCYNCFTTTCRCKPKNQQLVNPQGFLQVTHEIKCIWDVDEQNRKYLELGYRQINMGVIEINGFEQDTKYQLDRIFAAQQLINALEEDVALWLAWLLTVALCLFPFNYLTFDNIFSHPQLYFGMLYFQVLVLRHQFVGSSSIFTYPHTSRNKKKRQMLGLALKIDLFVFIILLIAGSYIILSYPKLFNSQPEQQFPNYKCSTLDSFYHNSQIAQVKCVKDDQYFIYHRKAPTFIYLYFLFAFTLRSVVNVSQPLSKLNIVYHMILIAILLGLAYFGSQWLQFSTTGLNIIQLGGCLGVAASIVCLCFLCRFIILKLKKGQTFQFQLSLASKRNESVQLLKQFKFGSTTRFSLEKQEYKERNQKD